MSRAAPDNPLGPRWLVLALFLHGALFSATRLWSREETKPRAVETIQVSLIEMAAPKVIAPPAPPPPAPPPKPVPPPKLKPKPVVKPRPVLAPRPVMLEPVAMPEPETPAPSASETPVETPAVSAPESAASQASAAPAAPGSSAASAGAPLVEARFDAAYLHNPKPPYPPASSRLREEGTVRLRVHVLPDGSADQVEIWRGSGSTPARRVRARRRAALAFRPRTARRRDDRLLGHRPHSFQHGVSAANTEASSLDPATRRAGQSTRQGEGRDGRDGPSSGVHVFDQACANAHIDHRLIPPRHPQTNGMVERFNGRISELCQQTRFESAAELEQTLKDYLLAYNHFIPQRAIGHRSPIDALKS